MAARQVGWGIAGEVALGVLSASTFPAIAKVSARLGLLLSGLLLRGRALAARLPVGLIVAVPLFLTSSASPACSRGLLRDGDFIALWFATYGAVAGGLLGVAALTALALAL